MGWQATIYVLRKTIAASGAEHEYEYYFTPETLLWPRPCWCEWLHLRDRLLGHPEREGFACACMGPVDFNVPGYTGRGGGEENRMRRFAESTLQRFSGDTP